MIHVLIVDDHPSVGAGTKSMIEQEQDMKAAIITDAQEALSIVKEKQYEVYLIDLYMPQINGFELAKLILQIDPDAAILIYTGFDLASHYNVLIEAGVTGFVSKAATQEQLVTAIRCALREEAVIPVQLLKQLRRMDAEATASEDQQHSEVITLSTKEQQILVRISNGLTNRAIALELSMSQRTVEYNLTKIFSKLGVDSRTEASLKAKELGLLSVQLLDSK